ncbi:MAG: glycosyltransferase [Anaerolineae bacterium]|nr:glycosyltransferase [Anaerolineae bacterium]MCI0608144.1 glycosyltransferase [Anaerolineae bacterium]
MNIVAIAGSTIPSDTANSIQVMKACSALAQLGHNLTLIVPDNPQSPIALRLRVSKSTRHSAQREIANRKSEIVNRQSSIVNLKSHYGLQTDFPIEWLSSSSRRLFTWQSVRRARALKPDLLYTWFPQSAVFGLLSGLPVIFEIHIQPTGLLGAAWHRAFASLRGKKRLVCITRALVNILEHDYNMRFQSDEVVIAPNGVDLERFASLPDPPTARRQIGIREAPTVMCTGHLYAGRGADLFLSLAQSIPHAHFVWVGGRSEDIASWKQRAEDQNISNITFTGFIPNNDLPLYQAAADILLMPYRRSIMGSSGTADSASVASPMKMFEYMAAGRAIISADLPVIREVLNERNAVFCEPAGVGNLELIIGNWRIEIETLLEDKARRIELGKQARRDVEKFSWLAREEQVLEGF